VSVDAVSSTVASGTAGFTPLSSAATMNMPGTGSTAPLTLLGQWKRGASEKMLMPRVIVG
jgi:hypothetical protein